MAGKCRLILYRRQVVVVAEAEGAEVVEAEAEIIVAGMARIGIYAAMRRVLQMQTVVQ